MSNGKRRRRIAITLATTMALGAGLFSGLGPNPVVASSHREAPLISADPQADSTDLYAFVSPDAPRTITIITSWIPFQEPAGGPNFYLWGEDVYYDINIDNDGDAEADLIYRFDFDTAINNPNTFLYNTGPVTSLGDPDLNIVQTYDVLEIQADSGQTRVLVDDAISVPSNVGAASMPNYGSLFYEGVVAMESGGRAWAGQSDDAFFLDLRVFDLLYGADFSEAGVDTLKGFNASSLAIRLQKSRVAADRNATDNPIIGIWTTASRPTAPVQAGSSAAGNGHVQVSRLGMPLVNEVVIPLGLKDAFNSIPPTADATIPPVVGVVCGYCPELGVSDMNARPEVPVLIEAIYGIPQPDSREGQDGIQRDDLVQVFLTGVPGLNQPANVHPAEMLRLNMSIPPCNPNSCSDYSTLGVIGGDVAGYPNGRRLADDVIDISLQVVEGELVDNPNDLGDGVDRNDRGFNRQFPFLALPHSGSNPAPHNI